MRLSKRGGIGRFFSLLIAQIWANYRHKDGGNVFSRADCVLSAKITIIALSTEKLRHSARTFEKQLRFSPFCGILFMPNNSIKSLTGIALALLYPLFSRVAKNCWATIKGYTLRAFP